MSSIRYKVKIKRAKPEKKNQPNFVLCYLWKWELFKTHSAIHKHFLLPIALLSFISRALYGLTQGQLILLNCCFPLPAVKKITRNKTPSREFSMDYCNPPHGRRRQSRIRRMNYHSCYYFRLRENSKQNDFGNEHNHILTLFQDECLFYSLL